MPEFDLASFINLVGAAILGGLLSFGIARYWAARQLRNLATLSRFLEEALESDRVSIKRDEKGHLLGLVFDVDAETFGMKLSTHRADVQHGE